MELPDLLDEDAPIIDRTTAGGDYIDAPSDTVTPAPKVGGFRGAFSKVAAVVKRPRGIVEAIRWSRRQIVDRTQSWKGLCQSHCRQAYGLDAWAPSAIAAWRATPKKYRHTGGRPEDAPRGALLYYDIGIHGHVAIATGIKTHDKCLSNDYVRQGWIDYTPRHFKRWGARYLGWSEWTPKGVIKVGPLPKPKKK